MNEDIARYLTWDSQFFGRRIAQLNLHRLDAAASAEALRWCQAEHIDCLYFLADSDDAATVRIAEAAGYLQTDVRLTFEGKVSADAVAHPSPLIRPARPSDLAALRAIAHISHTDTRFYYDAHFEPAKCDALYETWIENSMAGFAQAVFVAETSGEVCGYVTGHLRGQEAQLGLIAVSPRQQGLGLGQQLVGQFMSWAVQQAAVRTTVVTQARNIRAQRLYQRCGFLTASLQLWYHHWF